MRTRWLRLGCLACLALLLSPLAVLWVRGSCTPDAELSLPGNRRCTLTFNQWYTGRSVLVCCKDGVRVGTAHLSHGLLTDAIALFPGPDGNTVVCFSWLDISDAVFTVDLSRRDPRGIPVPRKLENVVDWSTFAVRASTHKEVAFVERSIEAARSSDLAPLMRAGRGTEDEKQRLLHFLRGATAPGGTVDPLWGDLWPEVPPEG